MVEPIFAAAAAYERFMGRWSRRCAPRLIEFASVAEGDAVLDIGSGTGALSSTLLETIPSVRVTGVDPSSGFVRHAQNAQNVQNAQGRLSSDRARFLVGDAQALELPDGSFDKTLSLLVLNFIPQSARALREMIRVTRSGGVVSAAVWDYGDGMEMLRVFWDEAVNLNPEAAGRDERNMPLCRRGELAALWQAEELERVDEQPIIAELSFASFKDYWDPFLGGQGPAGAYVVALPEGQRAALEARLRTRLLGTGGDRPFTLRARAWAVKGLVPVR